MTSRVLLCDSLASESGNRLILTMLGGFHYEFRTLLHRLKGIIRQGLVYGCFCQHGPSTALGRVGGVGLKIEPC